MTATERNIRSRNELVLDALQRAAARRNPWVRTAALAVEHIGGTGARTRVSNLRADGHRIESRRVAGGHQYEYRYLGGPGWEAPAKRRQRRSDVAAPDGPMNTIALF